jgi:sodium/hydrogen exchanger-like protein 6/7
VPDDYQAYSRAAARVGSHYGHLPRSYNHHTQSQSQSPSRSPLHHASPNQRPFSPLRTGSVFSAASSDSDESDGGEVLPLAPTSGVPGGSATGPDGSSLVGGPAERSEDSKWFQAIDERYLLPLFSNATASRTFHARRMRRGPGNGAEMEPGEEEEEDGPEVELGQTVSTHGVGIGLEESRIERGLSSPSLRRESDPALSQSP